MESFDMVERMAVAGIMIGLSIGISDAMDRVIGLTTSTSLLDFGYV